MGVCDMRSTLQSKLILVLAIAAGVIFGWIAIHEFSYASSHPYAAALAEVLAWGGIGGTLLAGAIALAWDRQWQQVQSAYDAGRRRGVETGTVTDLPTEPSRW